MNTTTPTNSPTATNTSLWTNTSTATNSPTLPPTSTWTFTPSFTWTATPSSTPTATMTSTDTPLIIFTSTPTAAAGNLSVPYPNPSDGIEPVTFIYENVQPFDKVSVKVYTTAFRQIFKDESVNTTLGQHAYGLDWKKAGLNPANGLYYVVIFWTSGNTQTHQVMKVLIVR